MIRIKRLMYSSFLLISLIGTAQHMVHNYGTIQMHDKSMVGFHTSLINDGSFDENLGLVGFYDGEESLMISGAYSPTFYDFEMAVAGDLQLDVSINIDNSLNFIYGNIQTPRNDKSIYVKLTENAIHNGATNDSKVAGHAAVEDQKNFSFPVGYDNILRPLQIEFVDGTFFAKCQYLYEDPDYPTSFSKGFYTSNKAASLGAINPKEFWNLSTSGIVQITLNWNAENALPFKVGGMENIAITGWNKLTEKWDNLGNSKNGGNIDAGWVTSNTFNANDYEIFTLGFMFQNQADGPGHYLITPNGDGANDTFVIEILEQSPNNSFQIYNREGLLVYEKSNYQNEFNGYSNQIRNKNNHRLPTGVYFYLLDLHDLDLHYQGYFYLTY